MDSCCDAQTFMNPNSNIYYAYGEDNIQPSQEQQDYDPDTVQVSSQNQDCISHFDQLSLQPRLHGQIDNNDLTTPSPSCSSQSPYSLSRRSTISSGAATSSIAVPPPPCLVQPTDQSSLSSLYGNQAVGCINEGGNTSFAADYMMPNNNNLQLALPKHLLATEDNSYPVSSLPPNLDTNQEMWNSLMAENNFMDTSCASYNNGDEYQWPNAERGNIMEDSLPRWSSSFQLPYGDSSCVTSPGDTESTVNQHPSSAPSPASTQLSQIAEHESSPSWASPGEQTNASYFANQSAVPTPKASSEDKDMNTRKLSRSKSNIEPQRQPPRRQSPFQIITYSMGSKRKMQASKEIWLRESAISEESLSSGSNSSTETVNLNISSYGSPAKPSGASRPALLKRAISCPNVAKSLGGGLQMFSSSSTPSHKINSPGSGLSLDPRSRQHRSKRKPELAPLSAFPLIGEQSKGPQSAKPDLGGPSSSLHGDQDRCSPLKRSYSFQTSSSSSPNVAACALSALANVARRTRSSRSLSLSSNRGDKTTMNATLPLPVDGGPRHKRGLSLNCPSLSRSSSSSFRSSQSGNSFSSLQGGPMSPSAFPPLYSSSDQIRSPTVVGKLEVHNNEAKLVFREDDSSPLKGPLSPMGSMPISQTASYPSTGNIGSGVSFYTGDLQSPISAATRSRTANNRRSSINSGDRQSVSNRPLTPVAPRSATTTNSNRPVVDFDQPEDLPMHGHRVPVSQKSSPISVSQASNAATGGGGGGGGGSYERTTSSGGGKFVLSYHNQLSIQQQQQQQRSKRRQKRRPEFP